MLRRRFLFWVGFGLFGLAEKFARNSLDDLAAALMRSAETKGPGAAAADHARALEHGRQQHLAMVRARTSDRRPVEDYRHHDAGESRNGRALYGRTGYLDESLVPAQFRPVTPAAYNEPVPNAGIESDAGKPSSLRIARHGRPPSRWLRSLNADELHIWLRTIDPPEAGVEGMTFFEHLTRDHSFDAAKISGLAESDQAKLHAAAHAGY